MRDGSTRAPVTKHNVLITRSANDETAGRLCSRRISNCSRSEVAEWTEYGPLQCLGWYAIKKGNQLAPNTSASLRPATMTRTEAATRRLCSSTVSMTCSSNKGLGQIELGLFQSLG